MTQSKRAARAKRRVKTMSLRRMGVPCTASKWGWQGTWRGGGLTPGEVQSVRKLARRSPTVDQFGETDAGDFYYAGAF